MTMTEQEIRADERKKVAGEIEGASIFDGASKHVCDMLAKYVRSKSADGWCEWKGIYAPTADRNLVVEIERRDGTRHTATVKNHGIWWDQSLNDPRVIVRWRLPVAKPEPKPFVWPWTFAHTMSATPAVSLADILAAKAIQGGTYVKDWRDVPITAGMLVDAYGGDYPELTRPVERAARVKASQALINEAAQKGWP